MSKQLTAIEWLRKEMLEPNLSMKDILEKAKQIEIDTIKEAYAQGRLDEETRFPFATDEDDYFDKKFTQSSE